MFRKRTGLWMVVLVLLLVGVAGAQSDSFLVGDGVASSDSGWVTPTLPVDRLNFFPVGLGLTWTYVGSPFKSERMIRILDGEDAADGAVYFWNGFQGDRAIRVSEGRVLERVGETWRLLFDFQAEVGEGWKVEGDLAGGDLLNGSTVEVVSRSEEVRVPYGVYEESIHLVLHSAPGLADAGVMEIWFVPRLGLVKWVEQSIAGPQTFELVSFVNRGGVPIGGDTDSTVVGPGPVEPFPLPFPVPVIPVEEFQNWAGEVRNGVRYEIGTDRETYGQDETVFIRYRVTVEDRDAVTFHFGSTQQYDLRLEMEDGETVWVWSAVRSFAQVLTEFRLKRGETQEFVDVLNVEGERIRGGMYRLVGFMPVMDIDGERADRATTEASVMVQVKDRPELAYLSGEVLDEEGMPVPGAQVALSSTLRMGIMDGAISASVTQADKSGAFRFGGVMEGPYVVTVTARGFQMATQPVSMVAGYHTVKITLKQSEGEEYTNGNVTAHRRLVAELATDRVDYEVGDSVYVRYRLTNPGPDAVTLTFPSGQEYDLVLEGSDGKVWQWADGKLFAEVTGQRVLAPGETFEFRAGVTLYSGWARPGSSYLLTGVLAVRPDAADGITQAETEGVVKFRVGSGEWPPGPPPGPIPGSTAGRGVKAYLDAAFAEDSVRVEYRVVNAGPDALRLMYRSGQQYDLVLDGPDGEVWRWSEGRGFTDALWEQEFAPGDSIVVQEAFSVAGMALPTQGTYVLTGFLAVRADEPDAVSATETEARLKFTVRSEDGKALRMDPVVTSGNDEAVGPVFVDFDNDGIVGFTDFLIFAGAFGTQAGTAGYQQVFDLDRNGAVEFRDFVLFVREYKK